MENVDLSKVKISKELKLKKAYLTFNLIVLALSGLRATGNIFTTVNNYNMVQDIDDDKKIDAISEIEFDDNRITLGSYSQNDLLHAKEAHIRLTNENDYSFLNNISKSKRQFFFVSIIICIHIYIVNYLYAPLPCEELCRKPYSSI